MKKYLVFILMTFVACISTVKADYSCDIKGTDNIPGVNGTTFSFKIDKNTGDKSLCIKLSDSEDTPCTKFNNNKVTMTVTGKDSTSYIYTVDSNNYNNIFKNVKSDNSKFDCPSNIYGTSSSNGSVKSIVLTTKESTSTSADQTTNTDTNSDSSSTDKKTVYRIRKASISINLDLKSNACDVLGEDLKAWLQWLLDVIRIGGIVLSVVLGIMEYIKAIASSNKDALSKANKSLGTRVICCGILFITPIIIEFILQLVSIGVTGDNPTCGLY